MAIAAAPAIPVDFPDPGTAETANSPPSQSAICLCPSRNWLRIEFNPVCKRSEIGCSGVVLERKLTINLNLNPLFSIALFS